MYVGCTVLYCIVLHCTIISLKIFKLKKKRARERETLENACHVSPRSWEITKDNIEGGATKSGVWFYLAH